VETTLRGHVRTPAADAQRQNPASKAAVGPGAIAVSTIILVSGMLKKIHIENYRVFEQFKLDFRDGLNVLVGDNDCGKTTVLEAVHLALTSRLRGRLIANDLSPHLVNQVVAGRYLDSVRSGGNEPPPEIVIDLYLEEREETAFLKGTNNTAMENACGLRVKMCFSQDFADEYRRLLEKPEEIRLVPTEYYRLEWHSFAGNAVTARSVPISLSYIDASSIRLQSGADRYVEQIINQQLDPTERAELARAYRMLRETFADDDAIQAINTRLSESQDDLTDKELSLSVDVSQKASWESNLVPHLDDLPFQYIGSGAQAALKILLALQQSADRCHVILIEEPENHQSPTSLGVLIKKIAERCEEMQVVATTHSSFVLNKLGLDRLILIGRDVGVPITGLPAETLDYFKKLPGYDTLRAVLARRVILVEGPSDELVVQRAYLDAHGCLPGEDGVAILTCGLSFARFLNITKPLGIPTAVVTDNDGKDPQALRDKYEALGAASVHVGELDDGVTLEPQIVSANELVTLNGLFGTDHADEDEMCAYMKANKTVCALAIFEAADECTLPAYLTDAVAK
jgi:putative ATP-dependent endonuclease of the OLD family